MNIALKIATIIKKTDPKHTHSIELMQYALSILLNTFFVCLVVLVLGWATGEISLTILALSFCIILRMVSGGVHLKKVWTCNVFSIGLCAGVPHLPILSFQYFIILNSISLLIMILYAPYKDRNTRLDPKFLPLLKGISILLVLGNYFIASNVLVLIFFIQSLTIIPWGRRFEKYD